MLANGAGSIIVEICTETVLQEELPDDVFARAYGFAFPVSIAGIAAGSIVAAPLVAALGLTGALTVIGARSSPTRCGCRARSPSALRTGTRRPARSPTSPSLPTGNSPTRVRAAYRRGGARGRIEIMTSPRAGQPASPEDLVDVAALRERLLRPAPRPGRRRAAGQLRHVAGTAARR